MKQTDMILPHRAQYGLAIAFLLVPIVASIASLSGNIHYNLQFSLWTVVIFAAADVARIVLPTMASLIFGWTWWLRLVVMAVAASCAWTAINYVADARFQDLFTRTEKSASYADNKGEITRIASALSGIHETSTPNALKSQIDVKDQRITELKGLVADHSNPAKRGPCRATCEGYKAELGREQTALGSLQERLGQATTKADLVAQLTVARGKRSTEVTEVKETGLASALAWTGTVDKQTFDMSSVVVNALLYLFLVEGLCYLMAPAIVFLMRVAAQPVAIAEAAPVVETVVVEPIAPKVEEALAVIEAPATVPVVVAMPEPAQVTPAKLEEAAVNKARRRDQFGRFAKKRPLPKKKVPTAKSKKTDAKVSKPKLKLNALPRPVGENIIDLVSLGKLKKD